MKKILFLSWLVALLPSPTFADFALIPEYKKLELRAGADLFQSSRNFANDGILDPIKFRGSNVELADLIFWLEPTYGIAQDWAVKAYLPYVRSSLKSASTGGTVGSGAGIGDLRASILWTVKPFEPVITFEAMIKTPTGTSVPGATDEIVTGEGNVDAGFYFHTATKAGSVMFFLSPGLLARFGGYSMAGVGDAAIQLDFPRGFIRASVGGIFSFSETKLFSSAITVQDAPGSGGSYARLNGSPIGMYAGGKLGFRLFGEFHLEAGAQFAVLGTRYPNFFRASVAIVNVFDFFKPLRPRRVRDVPMNEDYEEEDED